MIGRLPASELARSFARSHIDFLRWSLLRAVVRGQLREKMLSTWPAGGHRVRIIGAVWQQVDEKVRVAWRGVVWPGRDTMSALRLRGRGDISMET